MNLISSFVNWWKTSSARASAEHYSLRFDAGEINEIRAGVLSQTAREKIKLRLTGVKKITAAVLVGCLLPFALLLITVFSCIGYSIYTSPTRMTLNPPRVCFGVFALFVGAVMIAAAANGTIKLQKFRRSVAVDLQNNRVAVEQGTVNIKVISSRNGSTVIEYRINGILFQIFSDAIGSETYQHFFSGAMVLKTRQTTEEYRFYYLPQSKLLLHFEQA